jgi:hypothetical protein
MHGQPDIKLKHYVPRKQPKYKKNIIPPHRRDFNGLEMRNIACLSEDIK